MQATQPQMRLLVSAATGRHDSSHSRYLLLLAWLKHQWYAFRESFDPDHLTDLSSPRSMVVGTSIIAAAVAFPAYVEPMAHVAQFRRPWLALLCLAIASIASHVTWRRRARGNLAAGSTLIDLIVYVSVASFSCASTQPPYSYGYAARLVTLLVAVEAHVYSFTVLFALAICVPSLGIIGLAGERLPEFLLVTIGALFTMWLSYHEGIKRELQHQNAALRSAISTVDQIADASVDIAIVTAISRAGSLMHELRNEHAALDMNLQYLESKRAALSSDVGECVQDLCQSNAKLQILFVGLVDALKSRTAFQRSPIDLRSVVDALVEKHSAPPILEVSNSERPSVAVFGELETLLFAFHNIIRNASEAHATTVRLSAGPDPAGENMIVTFEDNGPGFPQEKLASPFKPFHSVGKDKGLGMGLYLTKRRIELLGGRIEASNRPNGGASVRIHLPLATEPSSAPSNNPSAT